MKNIGYYNGSYGLIEEMKIPMNDRVVYFGDGVYDATYVRNHIPFALSEHIDRFYNSCRLLEIPFCMPRVELEVTLKQMVGKVDFDGDLMLYWQCTRGTAMRSHVFPEEEVAPNLLITVRPVSMRPIHKIFKLITMEDTRFYHCNIKTLNLIPSVIANQRAKEAGCDEAILHRGEEVTECAHSNLLIIKDGILKTAPLSNLILPGITRKHLLEIAKENRIPVEEKAFTIKEVFSADEVIVTSSGALCNAADEVDGREVGGRAPELLKTLQDAYLNRFTEETTPMSIHS